MHNEIDMLQNFISMLIGALNYVIKLITIKIHFLQLGLFVYRLFMYLQNIPVFMMTDIYKCYSPYYIFNNYIYYNIMIYIDIY